MSFSTLKYDGIYDFKHFLLKQFLCIFQNGGFSISGFLAWGIFYWSKSIDFFVKTLQFQYLYLNSIGRKKIMQPFFNKMAKTQISDTGTHNLNCMGKIPCLIF